jgi:hypothetical protein
MVVAFLHQTNSRKRRPPPASPSSSPDSARSSNDPPNDLRTELLKVSNGLQQLAHLKPVVAKVIVLGLRKLVDDLLAS